MTENYLITISVQNKSDRNKIINTLEKYNVRAIYHRFKDNNYSEKIIFYSIGDNLNPLRKQLRILMRQKVCFFETQLIKPKSSTFLSKLFHKSQTAITNPKLMDMLLQLSENYSNNSANVQ